MTSYLESQLANAEGQLKLFSHAGAKPLPRRAVFSEIERIVGSFRGGDISERFNLLSGLRGTGKTTMLAQVYRLLLEKGVDRSRVLYASMDSVMLNLGHGVNDLVNAYEERLLTRFHELKAGQDVYLLLDEVQYDPDWATALKVLYDRSKRVFILATGSSMVALTTTTDVARRANHIKVGPLTFGEYLLLSQGRAVPERVKEGLMTTMIGPSSLPERHSILMEIQGSLLDEVAQTTGHEIVDYLRTGSLPSALGLEWDLATRRINSTLDRVVDQDLATLRFDRSTLISAHRLLTALAVTDKASHEALCTNLGINNRTLIQLIQGLEAAGVIDRVAAYGSETTRLRKTPKYKFVAPAMRTALLTKIGRWQNRPEDLGMAFEDVAVLYLRQWVFQGRLIRFDHLPGESEADMVLQLPHGQRTALELSWGNKSDRQLRKSMERHGIDQGILVADQPPGISPDGKVLRIPRDWFLFGQ